MQVRNLRRLLDRSVVVLFVLSAAGHGFAGTLMSDPLTETETLWSFSGSIAAWAIAAFNWLRIDRPGDRALAFLSLAGALCWIGLMLWLMPIADMWNDPRPWVFIAECLALCAFSAGDLIATGGGRKQASNRSAA
jgi:hypothetical protein